jgi:hypothetical protein
MENLSLSLTYASFNVCITGVGALLHNPYDGTTPSQRQAAVDRTVRLAKFASRAMPETGILLRPARSVEPEEPEPVVKPVVNYNAWIERQKEPWFSIVGETSPHYPRISVIQEAAMLHFGLTRAELISERRTRDIVVPRQIAMYLAKILTPRSLPEIGRRFGGKDHTTVLSAVRKITFLTRTNWLIAYDVAHVEALI